MEPKSEYLTRFTSNRDMRELYPTIGRRTAAAKNLFRERWENAPVTVTKADGNQFFID